jgi:predicted NBD/HSP70 family sugar kinase
MNIFDIKKNNRNKIYFFMRDNKIATKQDIVNELGLSLPTVTQNLESLAEQGLICSQKKIANQLGGRNPIAYSYMPLAKVAIGLDITKHHINTVIVDLDGSIIKHQTRIMDFDRSDNYLKILGEEVESIIDNAGINRANILGVGIGVPGLINYKKDLVIHGRVIDNMGMTGKDFAKYIPYSSELVHDKDASGFSEIWISPDLHNAFYLSLCVSVGGSIFINDSMHHGDGQYNGEVGHVNIVPDGKQCYCGKKGCFDAYCNSEVLSIHTNNDLDLFFNKLKDGDEKLMKVWDEYLDYLAPVIHDIRMLFGCTIILGGYIGAYMKDYMDVLYKKVDQWNPFSESSRNYLVPCKNRIAAVATGASLYIVKEYLNDIN